MIIKIIHLDKREKTNFYSVVIDDSDDTEFEKFINKFTDSDYEYELHLILAILKNVVGDKKGARNNFFRPEREAHALPSISVLKTIEIISDDNSDPTKNFPLRLYCLRISEEILILGSGGVKTSNTFQDSPDCKPHAELMIKVHKAILEKIKDQELQIEDDCLELPLNGVILDDFK